MLRIIHCQENATYNKTPHTSIRKADICSSDATKCWRGCGTEGTVTHSRWAHQMGQPLPKTVGLLLTKLNTLYRDRAIAVCGTYPKESETMPTQKADVYSSFIHNFQNLGATKMFTFSR